MLKKLLGFSMSSWMTAVFSFVVLMLSTHLYDSDNLGKINFVISVVTILASIMSLGLDQGYLRFYSENKEPQNKRMLASNILMSVSAVLIVLIFSLLFSNRISNWLFDTSYVSGIILLLSAVSGLIVLRGLSLPWRAKGKVLPYSVLAILYSGLMKGGYIFSYPFGTAWQTALLFYTCIITIAAVSALMANRHELCHPDWQIDRGIYRNQLMFSLPLIPSLLMTNLNNSIPQFVIRTVNGFSTVALYSTAVTLASALNILQSGFNTFWAPYVYENYKTGQEKIQKIHNVVVHVTVLFALAFMLLQNIVFLFFKQEYSAASQFLPFLVLAPLTYTIGETTQVGIGISKRSYLNIIIYSISAGVNFVLSLILVTKIGVMGAALSAGIAALTSLTLKTMLGNHYYKSSKNNIPLVIGMCIYFVTAVINALMYPLGWERYGIILLINVLYGIYSVSSIKKLNIIRRGKKEQ